MKVKAPTQKKPPVRKPAAKPLPPKKQAEPKETRTPRSKIIFVLLIIWGVAAISVFCANFSVFSNDDRYLQTGEEFVRALVMQDETTLSGYIHSSMRGNLYPLMQETADACVVHGSVAEDVNAEALSRELSEQYGLQEAVLAARWIFVEYTVETHGQAQTASIEILLANIGGDIYAVKTRNITDNVPISSTT